MSKITALYYGHYVVDTIDRRGTTDSNYSVENENYMENYYVGMPKIKFLL